MTSLMVDTSAYSAFKRGHSGVVDALQLARSILIPVIVLGELLAGFEISAHREKNRSELKTFQENPRVKLVKITGNTAKHYANIYAYLRGIGRPIPTKDLWIAATCMEHGTELLTLDSHFLSVPQIIVSESSLLQGE